ncbi:MAG: hypothetical protein ACJ74O_04315 [Frankiaceae bacterium]
MLRPRMARGSLRSTLRSALTAVLALLCLAILAVPADAAMPSPSFGPVIEPLTDYQPQTTCDPVAKPGVVAFRAMVLAAYAGTGDDGITRACSIGGTSEHKEGRAWDWMVSVNNPAQVAQVNDLLSWLFATDQYGNQYAMARRLGIMYVIWNKRIWGAYATDEGWRCYYACAGKPSSYNNDPHTGHVHFSFDWDGALKRTTYWGYGLVKTYQQWPGQPTGTLGAVTTGPTALDPTTKVYVEDEGSVIAAERIVRH